MEVIEADQRPSVELSHSRMVLRVRPGTEAAKRQAILEEWQREQLRKAVPPLIEKWGRLLGVTVRRFFVQRMKTKWGSCNHRAGSIRLNTDLARKPRECLEYIVVHEMAHLLEPTHNARFMALMNQFMPKWQSHRDALNRLPVRQAAAQRCADNCVGRFAADYCRPFVSMLGSSPFGQLNGTLALVEIEIRLTGRSRFGGEHGRPAKRACKGCYGGSAVLQGTAVSGCSAAAGMPRPNLSGAARWLERSDIHRMPLFASAAAIHAVLAAGKPFGLDGAELMSNWHAGNCVVPRRRSGSEIGVSKGFLRLPCLEMA
jgi:Protein of unknown function DUF45